MVDWGGKVAAWFVGVASVSTTLAALIAVTAKQPLQGGMRLLFVALVVIAIVSFAAMLLTGLAAVRSARQKRRRAKSDLPADSVKLGPIPWSGGLLGKSSQPANPVRLGPTPRPGGPLAYLIMEGRELQKSLGPSGNGTMWPPGEFNRRYAEWTEKVRKALEPWPGCSEQFISYPPVDPSRNLVTVRVPMAYDRIEHGISVLEAVIARQSLGG